MSHDHFNGKFEVELKYRIQSKKAFLQHLNTLEYQVMLEDNSEFDQYFDFPDRRLKRENKSVCLREMQPSGIKLWIVKGPEADRCEAVNVSDVKKSAKMLSTMGYSPVFRMEKMRSIYFVNKYHITLDHLQGVGDFAEFAIMTDDESLLESYRKELIQLASGFGLSDEDLEHRSYKEMAGMD